MARDTSTAAPPPSPPRPRPLDPWAARALLLGLALLGLGTIIVILGVQASGLLLPGVVVLDVALLVLAASGILAIIGPND